MKVLLVLALVAAATALPKQSSAPSPRHIFVPPKKVFPHVAPRIVNGQEAEPHSIPYQAWLRITGAEGSWLCGGSLISENFVLTAGHCGDGATSAVVILGAHRAQEVEETQTRINTKNIIVHEEYMESDISNDIAVFELAEPAPTNEYIKPGKLPSRSLVGNTLEGESCRVSGWGLTDGFGDDVSDVLMYADSVIISNSECDDVFGIVKDSQICMSGDELKSSCNGDSGGPLVVDDTIVGVVSYGVIWCLPGYPSAYTRVTSYLDWLEKQTDVVIS